MGQKHVFITGGVVSSLGKGITAASLGRLLKQRGIKVAIQKFDPYINVDPGTMNPYQHGEVFVTDDGAETDLDLGHYERFIDENLTRQSSVSSGQIYLSVINRERNGDYQGGTVQVVPHITDEIKRHIITVAPHADVVITEIGGTVGDIESQPFIEAIRQMRWEYPGDCLYIHVALAPYLKTTSEIKTKPVQHSVKELSGYGVQPDIVVCRTEKPMTLEQKEKIAINSNISLDHVIENGDAQSIYEVPLILEREGLAKKVCDALGIKCKAPDLREWEEMVERQKNAKRLVKIALVGKYIKLQDAYLSVAEALSHAGIFHGAKVVIDWISTDNLNDGNVKSALCDADGILIPGGFGIRGIEEKIKVVQYARENRIPFFGICLGMQMAVIEFARNVLGLFGANSTEVDPSTKYPVIDIMADQISARMGGTMRLGKYSCRIAKGSKAFEIYGQEEISERHRHRYEFNNEYLDKFRVSKMNFSGINPERNLVEIIELRDHPWFIGVQFHPEFKSRVNRPHPLFREFVGAALEFREAKKKPS